MFAEVLELIPDPASRRRKEKLYSLADAVAVHPSWTDMSPEAWILFLSKRPDIQGKDREDALEVIRRLWAHQDAELIEVMETWRNEDKSPTSVTEIDTESA